MGLTSPPGRKGSRGARLDGGVSGWSAGAAAACFSGAGSGPASGSASAATSTAGPAGAGRAGGGGERVPLSLPSRPLHVVDFAFEPLAAGAARLHIPEDSLEGSGHLVEKDVDLLVVVAAECVVEALPLDLLRGQAHQSPPLQ